MTSSFFLITVAYLSLCDERARPVGLFSAGESNRSRADQTGAPLDDRFDSYLAHIFSAQSSLDIGDTALALRWLEKSPAEFRGWEYDYLRAQTDMSLGAVKVEHDPVRIEVSPNGRYAATSNHDGTVTVRDLTPPSIEPPFTLSGHTSEVWGIAFTPDSKQIVTTSRDFSVRLWDIEGRKEIATLGKHPTTPYSVAVSPDGNWAVTPGWQIDPATRGPAGLVTVWDLKQRKQHKQWMVTTHPIAAVAFSPDGTLCAVGCWEYQTIIYRTSDWSMVREIWPEESESYKAVDWLQFSPDGKSILAAHKDQTARRYDVETGRLLTRYVGKGNNTCARFDTSRNEIVTSWTDQNLRIYSLDGTLLQTLRGHTNSVRCFAFDRGQIVSIGEDQTMRRWIEFYYKPRSFRVGDSSWSAVPSPDGSLIATGGGGDMVRIWRHDGGHVRDLVGTEALVVDVSWSPDGSQIVGGSNDRTARIWSVANGELRHTLRNNDAGQVRGVAWGDGFVAVGQGKTLILWDPVSGERLHELKLEFGAYSVAASFDRRLVAAGYEGKIAIVDGKSGSIVSTLDGANATVNEIAWSKDGRLIAESGGGGEIGVWDVASGKKLRSIKDMTLACWALAFSPDGKRLAATGYDFTLRLFDVASGAQTFMLRDMSSIGFDVQWSADGKQLIHCDTDGRVTVLDSTRMSERLGP